MLKILTEIFCFSLFGIVDFVFMKKLLSHKEKILNKKNIALLILLMIISVITYTNTYLIEPMIVRILAGIIIYKFVFDESILKIGVSYLIVMVSLILADLVDGAIIIKFFSINQVRNCWYCILISNLIVLLLMCLLMNIHVLIKKISNIIGKINGNENIFMLIFFFITYIVSISILYNIANIYKVSSSYTINFIIFSALIILSLMMLFDKSKYYNLLNKYDSVFYYVQQFEDIIDNISFNKHENKNQLAIIKNYIEENNNKMALETINDICKYEFEDSNNQFLSELKNIPKGGIKGLVYYKIIVANNNKLNILIDISKSSFDKMSVLNKEINKVICRIMGVYFDNAIDAAEKSMKKSIAVEIYNIGNKIYFVFSNSFDGKIDIRKIGVRGYSSKGNGHGQGTYLAFKTISKLPYLSEEHLIINNIYVQKLIVDLDKIKSIEK